MSETPSISLNSYLNSSFIYYDSFSLCEIALPSGPLPYKVLILKLSCEHAPDFYCDTGSSHGDKARFDFRLGSKVKKVAWTAFAAQGDMIRLKVSRWR